MLDDEYECEYEDEDDDEDDNEYDDFSSQDSSDQDYMDDGYEDYSENEGRFAGDGGPYFFSLPTNHAIDELTKSFKYADILPPDQVRARIQAFLEILSEETNAADSFVRMSKVMKMCLEILIDIDENRLSRRMLFFELKDHFSSQLQVNRTIQDVVALLRCSSYSLGIRERERGQVGGRILIQRPGKPAMDCFTYNPQFSSDLNLLQSLVMKADDARCIIVVERHEIFDEMASNPVFNERIPSIILTPSGYPKTAARFLLHQMSRAFPDLPVLALVDWKPATLVALSVYKFGSTRVGLEAYGHGTFLQLPQFETEADGYACNVKWLGLRSDDLELIPTKYLKLLSPLNQRDKEIAESLISSKILQEDDRKELEVMMKMDRKADIEALCYIGLNHFLNYIADKIEQAGYIN